jgi:hypothetical protein
LACSAKLPANKKLPGVKRGGGSTLPGRLSRRCAELVGEIGENELYALLREHGPNDSIGARQSAESSENSGDPYSGLQQIEEVVCTELTTWCGSKKGPKTKKKKKQSKVKKEKSKKNRQRKKPSPNK